jgi:PAS domain S-box-containing protein
MFRNQPITRKLLTVILLTSGAVLTLTCGTFFAYELVTFRQSMVQSLSTLAQAIATNSTAALAFQNPEDARQVMSALAADPHVVAAALYDRQGAVFASYTKSSDSRAEFPMRPEGDGYRFGWTSLALYQPVVIERRRLGTLYLESDLGEMYQRFTLYGGMVIGVVMTAGLVAYLLAMRLQRHITQPVLALAETAKTVATRLDYSARAERFDEDELGQLTDAFNTMLAQIQERNEALRAQGDALRREVDERKSAEERFRRVVEAAPHATLMVDRHGRIALINQKGEELFGYRREELIDKPVDVLVPDRARASHPTLVKGFFGSPSARPMGVGRELFAQRSDGTLVPVEIGLSPLELSEGPHTLASIIDVTERKRIDDDLRRSNADLEQFAYIASHDLQEPLRMVASYTDLLAQRYRGQLDERADKYMHYIVDGAKRMQRLVADLLTYSRVGSQGVKMKPVNVAGVVKNVLVSLGPLIRETGASIDVADMPRVMADEVQLMQLLQNLIGNAIKFRSDRPPRVAIAAVEQDDRWLFSVQDNGIGIDVRFAERIFQMFQRLHEKERYEGSGIGLAIAKRIVERHRGRIWLESTLGEGTTFYFTLGTAKAGSTSTRSGETSRAVD